MKFKIARTLSFLGALNLFCGSVLAASFQSDGVTANPDHTVTISAPRLNQGGALLPLTSYTGICPLFGYHFTLIEMTVMRSVATETAALNADGSLNHVIANDTSFVDQVTCANSESLIQKGEGVAHVHSDHSVTFDSPVLLRGNRRLPLTGNVGLCALLGFDISLRYSEPAEQQTETAALNADGSFNHLVENDSSFVTEITCAHSGDYTPADAGESSLGL